MRHGADKCKLAVVLPEIGVDRHSHYAHYARLLEEVAKLAEVVLIVERGQAIEIPGVAVIAQNSRRPVARAVELALELTRLRLRGYRTAYGSYSVYFGVVGGLIGRLLGIRTAYWHCRSDFFDRAVGGRFTLSRLLRDTVPFILSLHIARRLVTGTECLAERYARTFRLDPRKIIVIPNDIDVARFRRDEPRAPSGAQMLFVHRLSRHQGARLLAPIFRTVSLHVPSARLTVVGAGPDESLTRSEFRKEIEEGRVEFLGSVPNSSVPELMHHADVLLMPSLAEGFPRVLLEAMASGLPFVASEVGGVRNIVGPGARKRLVRPGDIEGFAREAVALLTDERLREQLADEGITHVRRYDVARVARIFVGQLCEGI